MIISNDLLKELDEKFPVTAYDTCRTWDETCRVQGSRSVIEHLKFIQEEQNEQAVTGGDHKVTINMK